MQNLIVDLIVRTSIAVQAAIGILKFGVVVFAVYMAANTTLNLSKLKHNYK